jgi:hypothetical protein
MKGEKTDTLRADRSPLRFAIQIEISICVTPIGFEAKAFLFLFPPSLFPSVSAARSVAFVGWGEGESLLRVSVARERELLVNLQSKAWGTDRSLMVNEVVCCFTNPRANWANWRWQQ